MDRGLRPARRQGITKVFALVAIIVVGATVAAAGTVLSLSQGGASASTSSTSYASVTSSIPTLSTTFSSTTSRVSAVASTTTSLGSSSTSSALCLFNSTGPADFAQLNATISALVGNLKNAFNEGSGNATVSELLGNFSQMTVTTDIRGQFSAATSSSYQVVGRPVIGSLKYYAVNFTTSLPGMSGSEVVMFAPNGTATSVTSPLMGNSTGASAASMGKASISSFLIQFHSSALVSSIESDPSVAVLNSTTVHLGPTQVAMTYYGLKSPLTYCAATISKLIAGVGTVQGTGLTMLLYDQIQISEQGTTVGVTTSVDSLTVA